jgi:hypothetical protein
MLIRQVMPMIEKALHEGVFILVVMWQYGCVRNRIQFHCLLQKLSILQQVIVAHNFFE